MKLKLHHLNLCSTNVGAMNEFYRSVLDMEPEPTLDSARLKTDGYSADGAVVPDGQTQFHLATRDLALGFRMKQPVNPVERGHIAFRTDDIAAFKQRLEAKGIP